GQSPFVWTTLGAIAQATDALRVHTAVTAPTVRIHPAIIAQAAATTATMFGPGRFGLGVGTGEALNEHILGDPWPSADIRLEMLEEAVAMIRTLWSGETSDHDGVYYHLENARIYSLPDELPPIHVSGFGPKAISLAAKIGDGYMNVAPYGVEDYRSQGGQGTTHGGLKVCVGPDKEECVRTAHRLWPNEALPGELAQVLPTVKHFEQAAQLVTPEMIGESTPCGPDAGPIVESVQEFLDAGFDEVYIGQIGQDQDAFLALMREEVLPHFR
ncbi:MAG: dehydrogenase, partial [uncultured Rubrobacteraceae bacterium]